VIKKPKFDCCQAEQSQDECNQRKEPQDHCFQWKARRLEVLGGQVPCKIKEKGFREILLETVPIPKDSEMFDLTDPAEKAKSKVCNKNELAFKELVLSIDTMGGNGQVAFPLVSCCKNNNYKNSNAVDAWKHLTDKYAPNT